MFHLNRRGLLAAAALLAAGLAHGQSHRQAIKLLVGFTPGGGTDAVARLIANKLPGVLGQPVIVENLPGAGGVRAANALVAAAPDGNTFMVANNAVLTFQSLVFANQIKWNYQRDFAPVAGLTTYALGFAVPVSIGVSSVPEYLKWVKANPEKATFGSTGLGGQTHFLGMQFAKAAGIDLQVVPYKGVTPMVTDLLAGQVPAAIGLMDDMLKFHRAGRLRVIGVFSAKRSPLTPDIPTFAEQGFPNVQSEAWQAMWAPAKTPKAQIDRMQDAVRKVLEMPDVKEAMASRLNDIPTFRNAAELAHVQEAEMQYWEPIIKASGFKPE
ncbi:tripartite tricarboxylate transporter substrate-binding protein [Polaromonas sp. C04]|uniref:tripartite tricarboxylate transporter substrate-binding protein n=1 Tax=Polaromonas sp. C04 TaxID=1945857 RepID=UPI00256FC1C3|nr:tripartite tricarboxylate transporter substrate-binding protein [Polaromonas sp. C04]